MAVFLAAVPYIGAAVVAAVTAGGVWLAADKIGGVIEVTGDETEDVIESGTNTLLVVGALFLAYIILGGTKGL